LILIYIIVHIFFCGVIEDSCALWLIYLYEQAYDKLKFLNSENSNSINNHKPILHFPDTSAGYMKKVTLIPLVTYSCKTLTQFTDVNRCGMSILWVLIAISQCLVSFPIILYVIFPSFMVKSMSSY
jgi:hypothetical protein